MTAPARALPVGGGEFFGAIRQRGETVIRYLARMRRGLAPLVLASLLAGCALRTGPAPVPLPSRGSARPATLLPGSPRGFYTLYVGGTGFESLGQVRFARSREELAALWRERRVAWPAPEVDFETHLVVAFADQDDGCLEEIGAFALDDRGVLTPSLAHLSRFCIQPLTATMYIAAVARAALPAHVVLRLERGREISVPAIGAVTLEGPPKEPPPDDTGALSSPLGALRGALPLPAEGEVEPRFLRDGTPVWVARHAGGEVSVLSAYSQDVAWEADAAYTHRLTYWDPDFRRFSGRHDERGVPVLGRARPSLLRHRAAIASGPACAGLPGAPPTCVQVGEVAPGSPRRHVAPRREGPRPEEGRAVWHLDREKDRGMSVEEALAGHEGEVVLVDASMVLEDGAPARLCKVEPNPGLEADVRCPGSAPVVIGQRPWPCDGCVRIVRGPLFARVSSGHFRDVADTGGGFGSHSIPGATFRPKAELRAEIGAGFVVSAGGAAAPAGGMEVSWGLRGVFHKDRDPTSTAMRVLVGNVYGFDLRAQLTHREEAGGIETGLALGVVGRLGQHHDWVRLPSLLGLLAPEVGVLLDSRDPARLYLGVSLPIAFRLEYAAFGLEAEPALRWVPDAGGFTGLLSLKGLTRW